MGSFRFWKVEKRNGTAIRSPGNHLNPESKDRFRLFHQIRMEIFTLLTMHLRPEKRGKFYIQLLSNRIQFHHFPLGRIGSACKFLLRHWRTFFALILYIISLNLINQKRRFLKCIKNCMENLYSLRNYLNAKPILPKGKW